MTNKEDALVALDIALSRVNDMAASLDRRIIFACVDEARDRVSQISELKRPRRAGAAKKAPQHSPREVAILGGDPSL